MQLQRTIATSALVGIGLFGVTACGSDNAATGQATAASTSAAATTESESAESTSSETSSASTSSTSSSSSSSSSSASSSATEDSESEGAGSESEVAGSAPAGDAGEAGAAPAWANPVTTPGTLIATINGDSFTVDVYQVGIEKATKAGFFANPDTNEPIIAIGDDLVFVNYVITNTGADTIPLGSSLVSVSARYDDWPYLQGMDSITDSDLFDAQGVNSDALAPGAFVDPSIYEFAPGETFSYGENFKYQAGSPITFDATLVPVDEAGELVHDLRQEAEGAGVTA